MRHGEVFQAKVDSNGTDDADKCCKIQLCHLTQCRVHRLIHLPEAEDIVTHCRQSIEKHTNCIVLYLYIYIAVLAVHTNQKCSTNVECSISHSVTVPKTSSSQLHHSLTW